MNTAVSLILLIPLILLSLALCIFLLALIVFGIIAVIKEIKKELRR